MPCSPSPRSLGEPAHLGESCVSDLLPSDVSPSISPFKKKTKLILQIIRVHAPHYQHIWLFLYRHHVRTWELSPRHVSQTQEAAPPNSGSRNALPSLPEHALYFSTSLLCSCISNPATAAITHSSKVPVSTESALLSWHPQGCAVRRAGRLLQHKSVPLSGSSRPAARHALQHLCPTVQAVILLTKSWVCMQQMPHPRAPAVFWQHKPLVPTSLSHEARQAGGYLLSSVSSASPSRAEQFSSQAHHSLPRSPRLWIKAPQGRESSTLTAFEKNGFHAFSESG